MIWTDPHCADLDERAAADMRKRERRGDFGGEHHGWHPGQHQREMDRIAAQMRERYLSTGKGCKRRAAVIAARTAQEQVA